MLKFTLFLLFGTLCKGHLRPNIVVILTDDQDLVLGGMDPMQNVQKLIGNEGVTFENAYVTSPICCPSRASFLTGMYVHNHGTRNNSASGGCCGPQWAEHETNTFAAALRDAGYTTFYAGKYLNEYGKARTGGPERVPPGWSDWYGLVGNSVYYDFTISNNGVPTHSTNLYLTDVIRDLGLSFIDNQTESQPFLMVLAPPAPHQPFTPAPRHQGKFNNVTVLRNPSFNIVAEDKHWLMSMPPTPLPDSMVPALDHAYRSRWEALLAVDEMVADLVEVLDTNSMLENTYLIYTSDNGYHIGQFSQVYDKRQPYETDIKVPLLIKGPGIGKKTVNRQPVLNIDLAPTLLELAGVKPLKTMDGHPIDLSSEAIQERNMLVEYHGEGNDGTVDPECPWVYDAEDLAECSPSYECKCQDSKNNTYGCIRHIAERINMKYCLFSDNQRFIEAYDLSQDPFELTNIADQMLPAVRHWYQLKLARMLVCKGAADCDDPLEISVLSE